MMKANIQAQHKAVNDQLKQFIVLITHFQHMKTNGKGMTKKRKTHFSAIAEITQLQLMHEMKTFGGVDHDVAHW